MNKSNYAILTSGLAILTIIITISALAYAVNILTSSPFHSAQQIVNSGGRVFNDQGQALKCDNIGTSATATTISQIKKHSLTQILKSSANMGSADANNNGVVDIGVSLTIPSTQQLGGDITHNINELHKSASNLQKIDSNNNGWPDSCDCVLDQTSTDENNCGTCGNVCTTGKLCCSSSCINTQTDENNCGTCGKKCAAGALCQAGSCVVQETIDLTASLTCTDNGCGSVTSTAKTITKSLTATFKIDCTGTASSCWGCTGELYKNNVKIDTLSSQSGETKFTKSKQVTLSQGTYRIKTTAFVAECGFSIRTTATTTIKSN